MDLIELDSLRSVEELSNYDKELVSAVTNLEEEFKGLPLPDEKRDEYAAIREHRVALEARVKELKARQEYIESMGQSSRNTERTDDPIKMPRPTLREQDIYDLSTIRSDIAKPGVATQELRDRAMRALDIATFSHPNADHDALKGHVEGLLRYDDDETSRRSQTVARIMLLTGSPNYRRAFAKAVAGRFLTTGEQNELAHVQSALQEERTALGVGSTGFPVVWTLDPTLVPTSNFAVNPWRAMARIVTIAGTNEWRAVTSGGITASYVAEGTEATDNTPTLAQPDIFAERAQAYAIYSIEAQQDWAEIATELAGDFQDAKDTLEATQFATGAGHGSQAPKGVLTGATNTTQTTTTGAFVVADVYKIFEALPPRFRPRAQFAANLFIIDKIRQFGTSDSLLWLGQASFQQPTDAQAAGTVGSPLRTPLLGRGLYEATAMAATLTTTTKILLVGDFRYFVIVDRVGMNIELDPMVLGSNRRPTGQRALYAYWRNSSDVLSANAFQTLVT